MISKSDYVVVTEKALEQGFIGFAYRVPACGAHDSGWRMMYSRDEDRLALVNPDKICACGIRKFLQYFPDTETCSVFTEKKKGEECHEIHTRTKSNLWY